MSCCVIGCVRDWEYASLGENACRDGKKKNTNTTSEEKQNCNKEVSKGFRKRNSAFEREADLQIPERKNFGYEKKGHRHHKDYFFCFVLNYC